MEKLPCATPHPIGLPSPVWQSGVSQMVKGTGWLSCDCQWETQTLPITPNEQTEPFHCQVYFLPVGLSANRLVSLHSFPLETQPFYLPTVSWSISHDLVLNFIRLPPSNSACSLPDRSNHCTDDDSCVQHPPMFPSQMFHVLHWCFKQGESTCILYSSPKPWLLFSASPVLLPFHKTELPHHSRSLLRLPLSHLLGFPLLTHLPL